MAGLEEYYKQLQTINRQRGLTGNQAYGRGMDESLAAGYFDAEMGNKRANAALQLQKEAQAYQQNYQDRALNLSTDYQNRALAQNTDYQNRALTQSGTQFQQSLAQKDSQFGQQMSTSKDTATTNLIGQAIGGIANLYTMNNYIDKLGGKKDATPSESPSLYNRVFGTSGQPVEYTGETDIQLSRDFNIDDWMINEGITPTADIWSDVFDWSSMTIF